MTTTPKATSPSTSATMLSDSTNDSLVVSSTSDEDKFGNTLVDDSSGVDAGLIGAIVGGGVGALLLCTLLACVLWRRRHTNGNHSETQSTTNARPQDESEAFTVIRTSQRPDSTVTVYGTLMTEPQRNVEPRDNYQVGDLHCP